MPAVEEEGAGWETGRAVGRVVAGRGVGRDVCRDDDILSGVWECQAPLWRGWEMRGADDEEKREEGAGDTLCSQMKARGTRAFSKVMKRKARF